MRELENNIQRAILLCTDGEIRTVHLALDGPPGAEAAASAARALDGVGFGQPGFSLAALTADVEKRLIRRALQETEGNKSRAAALLGITRKILRYKIQKYDLMASAPEDV